MHAKVLTDAIINEPIRKATNKLFGLNVFEIDPIISGERVNASARLTVGRQIGELFRIHTSLGDAAIGRFLERHGRSVRQYLRALTGRYGSQIQFVQMYDRPNLADHWGGSTPSPSEYTELLAAAGPKDRSVDGLVAVINDATTAFDSPLDDDRLSFGVLIVREAQAHPPQSLQHRRSGDDNHQGRAG